MSVYEISNIIEITNLINAISESNPELKSVTINSPGGGYYLYPLEYYIQGFISPEQLLEYFDFIDQKEFSLFESLSKRIKKPIKVNIQTCLGLDFKKKIRHYVSTINYPDNSSLIKAICESIQDPIYKKLLLDFNSITLQNLANIDYMTTYLKQANGTLIVENYLEDFILRKALKIAKKQSLDTKKLKGGVYIFPRVVANLIYGSDNSIKNSLYEAEGKLDISTIKEIIRFYRAELIRSESQYLKLHQGYWNEKYNLTKQNQITHRHQSQLNSTPSPVD
jgi:hypothetical protein